MATPEVFEVTVPKVTVPLLNVTFPDGVTPVADVTVAVNTTACPKIEGFGVDISTTAVVALLTVWVNIGDVLEALLLSPL